MGMEKLLIQNMINDWNNSIASKMGLYPWDIMQELANYADTAKILATQPEGTSFSKVHLQMIFYKDSSPIVSLGSAPALGWFISGFRTADMQ